MQKAAKRKVIGKSGAKKRKGRIAIVMSLFNDEVVNGLLTGCVGALSEQGYGEKDYQVLKVPGAFEIPLVAQAAAASKKFAGVVALGCVIRGETPHFEFVSLGATMGCLQAGLNTGKPVMFGVITVNNQEQAVARSRPDAFNKGREAALALLDTLETLESL